MKSLLRLLLHVFLRIVAGVARPLRENGCFVVFMMAAWGISVWRQVQYQGEVWTHSFELLVDLYLLCVLFTLLPQRVARVVRALCYGLGYLLPLFEVFLTERFLMLYTPTSWKPMPAKQANFSPPISRAMRYGVRCCGMCRSSWPTCGWCGPNGCVEGCCLRRARGWSTCC